MRVMDFLPFTRPHIDEDTIAAVADVLRSGWITTGPKCRELEAALSLRYSGRPVRLANSATAALEFALRIAGIGPGDEVIVPSLTWVATANVVLAVGATPVFVDVDPTTRLIDLGLVEHAVTGHTRAIMPVDLAGLPVDRDRLYTIAAKHRLRVIEDAAQSQGANWQGREIGKSGDLVCFSFHPNKNMTSIEGGAISFPGPEEIETVELERFHGLKKDDLGHMDALLAGGKSNLSDIAAAVGLGQLERLEAFNQRRLALATRYFDRLASQDLLRLPARGDSGHSWHIFAPLLQLDRLRISRAEFIQRMRSHDIGVGVHYPAMHLFSVYREQGWKAGDFPNSERIGEQTVTLPLFPAMRDDDVDRSCAAIDAVLTEARR